MNETILVVDDETSIADLVEVYLKNEGFRVQKCENGAKALEMVRSAPPDLAILDVMLPDLDGFSLCREIRRDYFFPILMLTAKIEDMDKITGLTLGADDYITKPFDLSVLKTKIAAIINNRRLYRKKYIDKSAFSDETSVINELDRKFMSKLVEYIEEKMMNENFSIDTLAMEMAMSRSVFFKKIKSLTGQNPQEFIRDIKMKKAATLLNEKKYSIGEIAYLTGYPNAKYFSTAFKKYYGTTPSTFIAGDQPADPL